MIPLQAVTVKRALVPLVFVGGSAGSPASSQQQAPPLVCPTKMPSIPRIQMLTLQPSVQGGLDVIEPLAINSCLVAGLRTMRKALSLNTKLAQASRQPKDGESNNVGKQ
jgi:hypothetical protein